MAAGVRRGRWQALGRITVVELHRDGEPTRASRLACGVVPRLASDRFDREPARRARTRAAGGPEVVVVMPVRVVVRVRMVVRLGMTVRPLVRVSREELRLERLAVLPLDDHPGPGVRSGSIPTTPGVSVLRTRRSRATRLRPRIRSVVATVCQLR